MSIVENGEFPICYILEARTISEEMNIPRTLYHYTDPDGLLGIFQGKSLWATQVQYLNDPNEWHHAIEIARAVVASHKNRGTAAERQYAEELGNWIAGHTIARTFVFALSEVPDLLSQWRGYCPDGGYAIGFNSEQLRAHIPSSFQLRTCIYDDDSKRKAIRLLAETAIRAANSFSNKDARDACTTQFINDIRDLAETFKHSSFSEECEWRLIGNVPVTDARSRWRVSHGMIVPYVALEMPIIDIVEDIIVGPKGNKELAQHSAQFLLWALGKPLGEGLKIRQSAARLA